MMLIKDSLLQTGEIILRYVSSEFTLSLYINNRYELFQVPDDYNFFVRLMQPNIHLMLKHAVLGTHIGYLKCMSSAAI